MLIAICSNGRKAGKDTVADYIVEWAKGIGVTIERRAFADTMKRFVALTLGWPDNEQAIARIDDFKLLGGLEVVENVPGEDESQWIKGRDAIINISEAAKTLFGPDFWVDQVLPPAPSVSVEQNTTLITDMRFPQEYQRVAIHHGLVVRVTRENAVGGRSENLLDDYGYDWIIPNNEDLDTLRTHVYEMMEGIYSFRV